MARRIQVYFADGVKADGLRLMLAGDLRRVCEHLAEHPDGGDQAGKLPVYEVRFTHPACAVTYVYASPNATKLLIIGIAKPSTSIAGALAKGAKFAKRVWNLIELLG